MFIMGRSIMTSIPELYRSVDMDGVILDCNNAYFERLGYTLEEVIGTLFFDHTPDEDRYRLRANFEEWKKTETHAAGRIRLETKNGETFEVVLDVKSRYDDNKNLVGRNSIMREVSYLDAMRKMYNKSSQEGYESTEVLHRSVNYNGIIIDVNQKYLDELGFTKDEVIGVSLLQHTSRKSRGNLSAHMENWRNGVNDNAKIWMRRKDGSEFPVMLVATNEKDADGALIGRTVALTPILD